MIRLDTTTRKLQVILGGAVAATQPDIVVSYSDATATTYTGGTQCSVGNSATAVDICAAPGASTVRDVDHILLRNNDSASIVATVRLNDASTLYKLITVTLLTGESLEYTHATGWRTLDANGQIKSVMPGYLALTGGTVSGALTLQSTLSVTGAVSTNAGITSGSVGGTLGSLTLLGTTSGSVALTTDATGTKLTVNKPLDVTGALSATDTFTSTKVGGVATFNPGAGASVAAYINWYGTTAGSVSQLFFVGTNPIGTDGSFEILSNTGGYPGLRVTPAGAVQIKGAGGWASGDKYLIVDASGNIHVSALGPAS